MKRTTERERERAVDGGKFLLLVDAPAFLCVPPKRREHVLIYYEGISFVRGSGVGGRVIQIAAFVECPPVRISWARDPGPCDGS